MSTKGKKEEKVKDKFEEVVQINKWDGSAVKHALDDSVKNALLDRPNMKEQFGLINTRLLICGLAVGVALLAHGWDYAHPFPESKPILMFSVFSYFVLMGVLTLHTTYREKGTFAVAVQKDNNGSEKIWEASSDMKKYDDEYTLTLSVKDSVQHKEGTLIKSCANFIDTDGVVVNNLVAVELNRLYSAINGEWGKKDK